MVVVIELDEDYLLPLEMKLAFAADEKVHFEFITEKGEYQKYFEKLRKIDVLVIDEKLFTEEISRHNIERIYILTEEAENEKTEQEKRTSVIKLFKYSNLNSLIGMILPDKWLNKNKGEIKGQIIVTCSPAGGTGCTTVSIGVAGFLANKQRKVLYINTQQIQYFQYYFDCKDCLPITVAATIGQKNNQYDSLKQYIKQETFDYLPELPSTRSNLNIDVKMYDQLINQISDSQDYDFIVIDAGNDLNLGEWKMLERADKVLVITEQDEYSKYKLKCLQRFVGFSDQEKFILVYNRFQMNKENNKNTYDIGAEDKIQVKEYIENIDQPITIERLSTIKGIQRVGMLMF